MTNDERLTNAKKHCFYIGLNDSGAELCKYNSKYGIAGIHYIQAHPRSILPAIPDTLQVTVKEAPQVFKILGGILVRPLEIPVGSKPLVRRGDNSKSLDGATQVEMTPTPSDIGRDFDFIQASYLVLPVAVHERVLANHVGNILNISRPKPSRGNIIPGFPAISCND